MEQENGKTFGKLLTNYRKKTRDTEKLGYLSRDRFGVELGIVMKVPPVSHDIIYKFENDKTKLRFQDRNIVLGIIQVLVKFKGISRVEEADQLLALSHNEKLTHAEIKLLKLPENQLSSSPENVHLTGENSVPYIQSTPFNQFFEEEKGNYTAKPDKNRIPLNPRTMIGSAPPAPTLYVGREQDMLELKKRLGIGGPSGRSGIQVLTTMRGWPGVGKTTTAAALAHDPEIIQHYNDGILWTSLGTNPAVLAKLAEWGRALGYTEIMAVHDVEEASAHLASLLRKKQILLIVDDVWNVRDVKPFMVGGLKCGMIITTRETSLANEIAAPDQIYPLRVLNQKNSLELLSRIAPEVYKCHSAECAALVADLEGLPLALRVAGRLLQTEYESGLPVEKLFEEIKKGALLLQSTVPIEKMDLVKESTPSVASVLFTSLDHLDENTRECYARLSVFAETPATFSLENIRYIWQGQPAEPIVKELIGHGLLEYVQETGRYQMHALLVKLASSLVNK